MKKLLAIAVAVASVSFVAPRRANAGFAIASAIGTGFVRFNDEFTRLPLHVETIVSYKILFLYADLGMKFNFESPRNFSFRPGVRLDVKLLYFRAAVPLVVNNEQDVGLFLGLGKIFGIGAVGLYAEMGVNLSKNLGFSAAAPVEFRIGTQFGF